MPYYIPQTPVLPMTLPVRLFDYDESSAETDTKLGDVSILFIFSNSLIKLRIYFKYETSSKSMIRSETSQSVFFPSFFAPHSSKALVEICKNETGTIFEICALQSHLPYFIPQTPVLPMTLPVRLFDHDEKLQESKDKSKNVCA
jgi:hypothetical protein